MIKHVGLWLVIASAAVGCDLPERSAVDTRVGGAARTPKDIRIPLRHPLQVGDNFWEFPATDCENETVAGKLFSRDIKITLSAQSNGEHSVTFRDYNGFVTFAARGGVWGRYMDGTPAGAFQAMEDGSYSYNDHTNKDNHYYTYFGPGQDNLGRSDTLVTVSGGGTTIRVPLRELYLQRVRDIVARAQRDQYINGTNVRAYRCIEDSEGYPYVINLRWGGGMVVEVWDPFLFDPAILAKAERREIDPLSLKPLAAFDIDWRKGAGTTSTPVDFARLRRQVYGESGDRDSLHFTSRGDEKWVLDGGLNTPHRQAIAHLRKGWEHQNASRRDQAVPEYTKAVELDPKLANAYLNRALCSVDNFYSLYSVQGLPVKVLRRMTDDFTRAMDLEPSRYRTTDTLSKRALCRQAAKDLAGAESDYSEIIRMEPANTSAWRERRSVRRSLGNSDGAASDDAEIVRLEAEEKRKSEENRRESIRKAEEARRDVADSMLVEAGMAKWPYEDSTYVQIVPPYVQKIELLKRRLKDVNEKPLVIQLAGSHAENNSYKFEQLGFKILKGKKVDSEEKLHLIFEAESDSSAEMKNGQGRKLESIGYGKYPMDRAYNAMLILYLKNKLDWGSEKYTEIAAYWDKAEQKIREKDEGAALEALDEIIRLDPEDRAASTRKFELMDASKNWAGIVAECSRLLQQKPEDADVRRRRLGALEQLKDVKAQLDDLAWLSENVKEDYYAKDYLMRRGHALTKLGSWKEAADVFGKMTERWSGEAGFFDRRAECFLNLGEPERADQMRAKSLELQRATVADLILVQEGIATWHEKAVTAAVRPEFRARHALTSIRLRDPARVVLYYEGPPGLGSELEKAGFQIETDRPQQYDAALVVAGNELRMSLPNGQVLGSPRWAGYYPHHFAIAALRSYAVRGRLPILGKTYEDLIPVYEDLLAALEAGDEAKELPLRQRMAEALPGHYELQMEYLLALQRAEDWTRVIEVGTRIASLDPSVLESSRKLTVVNYSIAADPVEGGLKAVILARLRRGEAKEALADADAWLARGTDTAGAMVQKITLLKLMGDYRAAADVQGALADFKLKKASSEWEKGYAIADILVQSDLLKLAGDEAKSREVYRKAMLVTLQEYGPLTNRANDRARRGDFAGAMADINDAIEKQGEKVQASSYASRAQIRLVRGDTDGALQDYAAALRITKDGEYYRQRALLFEKQGKAAEAAAERKLAWSLPISYPSYYSSRAKERRAAGDAAGALEDHAKGIEQSENAQERSTRLAERAETRRILKDTAGALDDLEKAAEATRDRAEIAKFHALRADIRRSAGDFRSAIQDLGRAIDASPTARGRADLLESRAHLKVAVGDAKGAIDDFGQAIAADETWARVLRRAALHQRLGDPSRAADDVKFALTLPFKATDYYSLAYAAKEAGAPPRVWMEIFDRCSALLPATRQGSLLSSRVSILQSAREFATAERELDAALTLNPRADLFMYRAFLRRDKGDREGALADLAAACKLPVDSGGYYYLGSRAGSRFSLGDLEGARKEIEETARRFRSEIGAQIQLAEFQARDGRLDEAIATAEKVFDGNRTDYSAVRTYAQFLALRGRKEDAHRAFENYPYRDYDSYWEYKMQLELLAGDLAGAVKVAETGLEKFPGSTLLRLQLAELYLQQGNLDAALKMADYLRSLNFMDATAFRIRAIVLAQKGDAESEKLLALASAPSQASVRVQILLASGKLDEALKAAQQEVTLAPFSGGAKLLLARILLAKGDRAAAEAQIKAGLECVGPTEALLRCQFADLARKAKE